MSKRLTHPKHGASLDTAGMPVTSEPVEGGVCMVNASLPTDHDAHQVWREQSPEEKKQAKKLAKHTVALTRASDRAFLRLTRDALLAATDFVETSKRINQVPAWRKWREQLFDLPEAVKDPSDVSWPKPPYPISQLLPHKSLWPDLDWELD